MKHVFSFVIIALIVASVMCAPLAGASEVRSRLGRARDIETTLAADKNVVVAVCLRSGDIVVRGWDENQVRARSTSNGKIELRPAIDPATSAGRPATRIRVLTANAANNMAAESVDCRAFGDLELDVPRGATVQLKTRGGNVSVKDVARARIETMNGDIAAAGITKAIEVATIGGNISLKDSKGRARLSSISGDIAAGNVRALEDTDEFSATTVAGEVALAQINYARVIARTVSGNVSLSGRLARHAYYGFNTTSGEVTFNLPADSSFQLNATVAIGGEINSEFPIKAARDGSANSMGRTLVGTYGSGDATLYLSSFSGLVSLRKK